MTGVPTPFNAVALGATGGTAGIRRLSAGDAGVAAAGYAGGVAFLDSFGRPERGQTCSCERQQDSTVGQALHLNNGQTLNDKLRGAELSRRSNG